MAPTLDFTRGRGDAGLKGLACAGSGFLLSVLWFDLMFDIQVRAHRAGEIPEQVLTSIAAYYRRVTTEARPMNRLVALAMVATIAGIVGEIVHGGDRAWAAWLSLVLAGLPIGLAGAGTVRGAVRLGTRRDTLEKQVSLARAIYRQHVFCVASIGCLLVVQVLWAT